MAPPFEEDGISDIDSISVTSTKPSDAEAEYAVEKLLSEERDLETGVMKYLVKWEGYPLHLSTWEPAENLLADQILSDWQRDKEAIRSGVSQPFDMDLYWEVVEKHQDEKEERRRRRAAKRRRLGLPSRSGSVANIFDEDIVMGNAAESPDDERFPRGRQKQAEDSTPRRKGVAQKVATNSNRQVTMVISSDESDADSEGEGSLFGGSRTKSATKTSAGQSVSFDKAFTNPIASGARVNTTTAPSVTPANKVAQKRPSAKATASANKTVAAPLSSVASSANLAKRTQLSSSARKSAPSTASAFGNNAAASRMLPVLPYDPPKRKAPDDPFSGFGKAAPERKGRRISASNPKSLRFSNLAEENRVRKFGAKEAPPDPSVLGTFNFATGKYDEPAMKPRAAGLSSASTASSVFGRREAPAPTRQRSVSPPSVTAGARGGPTLPRDNTTPYIRVCKWWRQREGDCHNDRCSFAHHYITCPDWRQGRCAKKEFDCEFDHKEEGRDPIFRNIREARNAGVVFPGDFGSANNLTVPQLPQQLDKPAIPPPPSTGKPPVIYLKPSQIICQFWARGHCFKSAAECKFRHIDTGAPLDAKRITCGYWSALNQCKSKNCKFAHHETGYCTLGPRDESSVTCGFWLAGQCTGDRCEWAHHETGCISLGPPQLAPVDTAEMSPGEVVDDEPIAAPAAAGRACVAPTANMTPVSRRSSFPVPQNTDELGFINDVVLEVNCAELGDFKAAAQLACATRQEAAELNDVIGSRPRLCMENTVDARVLRTQIAESLKHGATFSTGDIVCKDPRRDHGRMLTEKLQQSFACGVIKSPNYTLVVYTTGTGEWGFLARGGGTISSQAALKFILLPALPTELPPSKNAASRDSTENVTNTSSSNLLSDAEMERLLKVNDVKTEERVFIMMPPSKADEMKRMVKIFKDRFKRPDYSGRETHVWTSHEKGKWENAVANSQRGGGGGLVLIHWEIPLWEIPHLAGMLHHSSSRIFSIGVDPHLAALERREPAFGCQRIFPMGDVVFITDDVFTNAPGKVLRIIDEVKKQNMGKPPGASRTKIATRPGVRAWFTKFVTEHEKGSEDPRWVRLLEAICDLCPDDKQDPNHPGNPSEEADLISIPAEQLPTFQTLLETDKAKATDFVVNWFAGWACMNASKFRRFSVCHEEPGTGKWELDDNYNMVLVGAEADPRGWAKEFAYLLVRTPELWLRDKGKAKK